MLRKTIFAGAAALTLGTAAVAPSSAFAWWYGQPGFHGWHGLPHGSQTGSSRQPAIRYRALPFAATPAPMRVSAEPVPATPIAPPPRVAAVRPPAAAVAAPFVPAAPVPVTRVSVIPVAAAPVLAAPLHVSRAYGGGCFDRRLVATPNGPAMRWVNDCY
jgi:hypothetical protein